MSGTLYTSWKDSLGVSHIDEPVAVYENGKIYAAADGFLGTTAKGALIGEYEDGKVYSVGTGPFNYGKRLNAVAIIESGRIYSISKSILGGISKSLSVGECSSGKVYSHSHKIIEGSESFGLYNGDEEGAAAAAAIALFKLESNVSAYDSSLNGGSSRKSSSEDDEDLWEKYGLLMPIVVTYRFFKYSFIVGKWIFGIIAWITGAITGAIKKHKEKKMAEEIITTEDAADTMSVKTESGAIESDDTSYEYKEMVLDEIDAIKGAEATDIIDVDDKEKTTIADEFVESTDKMCEETVVMNDDVPKSRLKSTMRTSSATSTKVAEKSDKFKTAGDL